MLACYYDKKTKKEIYYHIDMIINVLNLYENDFNHFLIHNSSLKLDDMYEIEEELVKSCYKALVTTYEVLDNYYDISLNDLEYVIKQFKELTEKEEDRKILFSIPSYYIEILKRIKGEVKKSRKF